MIKRSGLRQKGSTRPHSVTLVPYILLKTASPGVENYNVTTGKV